MNTESLPTTDAGSEFQIDGAAHRKERFAKSVRANGWMSSGVADERSVRVTVVGLQTCSESCMSTQTPCSQFCVEPAASVVDASAVWHGTASVPGGRFWLHYLHTLQLLNAADDWRAVEYRVTVVQSRHDQTAGKCACQIGRQ